MIADQKVPTRESRKVWICRQGGRDDGNDDGAACDDDDDDDRDCDGHHDGDRGRDQVVIWGCGACCR